MPNPVHDYRPSEPTLTYQVLANLFIFIYFFLAISNYVTLTVISVTITRLAGGQEAVSLTLWSSWHSAGQQTVNRLQAPYFFLQLVSTR